MVGTPLSVQADSETAFHRAQNDERTSPMTHHRQENNATRSTGSNSNNDAPEAPNDDHTTLAELKRWMSAFVEERNWQQYHNAKNLSMSLAIESAELMEHFQWITSEQAEKREGFSMEEVAEELADVLSYTLSIANALDIDLAQAMSSKMVKNRRKYPAAEQSSDRIVRRED